MISIDDDILVHQLWMENREGATDAFFSDEDLYLHVCIITKLKKEFEAKGLYTPSVVKVKKKPQCIG